VCMTLNQLTREFGILTLPLFDSIDFLVESIFVESGWANGEFGSDTAYIRWILFR
jgi:hypothetical protein